MVEILDIYDENLVKVSVKEREAVHQDGDWHRTFHCWIIYRDSAGTDKVVMQKRAPGKQFFPNLLDITAAGHYEAGETIADGIREIREELGISVSFSDLIPVGIRLAVASQNGLLDYEFNDVFLLINQQPLDSYVLQEDEVTGLVAIAIDDGLALFAGERKSIQAQATGLGEDVINLGLSDFIWQPDAYNYRLFVLAKRCLNGEKHLVI